MNTNATQVYMTPLQRTFENLASYSLASFDVKTDGTVDVFALDNTYKRYQIATGQLSELALFHPLLPASLKLARGTLQKKPPNPRLELYSDEVLATLDYLHYGSFEICTLDGSLEHACRIRTITQNKRRPGETQSFKVFLERSSVQFQVIDGINIPYVARINNINVDVSAVELDTRFPGWTTRYIEMKAGNNTKDLMAYIFNPVRGKEFTRKRMCHSQNTPTNVEISAGTLPADIGGISY